VLPSDKKAVNVKAVHREYVKWKHQLFVFHCVFHIALKCIQFIAQLAVVPLPLIQVFDTYAFLCFTGDNYCSLKSEYKLHLDQTALTFAFYCSLTLSFLFSSMLTWIPWPRKSEAASDLHLSNHLTKSSLPTVPDLSVATAQELNTNIANASPPADYILPRSQFPNFGTTAISVMQSRLPGSSVHTETLVAVN